VAIKNKELHVSKNKDKKGLNFSDRRMWGCLAKLNMPINKK
jgi:hypothetical protein